MERFDTAKSYRLRYWWMKLHSKYHLYLKRLSLKVWQDNLKYVRLKEVM